MTPGKDAPCYLGKLDSGGFYPRRASKRAPKICTLELRYSKRALPDGTVRFSIDFLLIGTVLRLACD